MTEEWKVIKDYPSYQISNKGRVWSDISNNYKKSKIDKGYCRVTLYINGIRNLLSVHRLVCLAFIPNPNNYPQVDHIDRNRTNNDVSNLRWVTSKMNQNNRDLGDFNANQQRRINQSTSILSIDLITGEAEYFEFQKNAERKYGSNVNGVLKGRVKTCKGKTFIYL